MTSRARTRTPVNKGKQNQDRPVLTVSIDGVEYKADLVTASTMDRLRAREALRVRDIPEDDQEAFPLAVAWALIKKHHMPDLSIDDLLEMPQSEFGFGSPDPEHPEA